MVRLGYIPPPLGAPQAPVLYLRRRRVSAGTPKLDVRQHASQLIQSGRDLGQYLQELEEAEQQVDQRLQEQVRHSTVIGDCKIIHCACS